MCEGLFAMILMMRRLVCAGLILPFAVAACGSDVEKTTSDQPAMSVQAIEKSEDFYKGEAIAETMCATCHAIGIDDESIHADAPPFRTLSAKFPIDALAEPLVEGIMVGHPDMPEFQFDANDVEALLTYIEGVQPAAR